MSILLKNKIKTLANDANVRLLGPHFLEDSFQGCSYDLRIGSAFIGKKIISKDHNVEKWWTTSKKWEISVEPSEIITILTLEEISLPNYISATVFAMNSFSSTGFLILNPGHIDPGYKGPVSICAINLRTCK